jgi:hypothetical protein
MRTRSARSAKLRVQEQLKRSIVVPTYELNPQQEAAVRRWDDENRDKPYDETIDPKSWLQR